MTLTIEYQAIANHLGWASSSATEKTSASSGGSYNPTKLGYWDFVCTEFFKMKKEKDTNSKF